MYVISAQSTLLEKVTRKWFCGLCSGSFDVKDDPYSGRLITEKTDKATQEQYVDNLNISKKLNIYYRRVLGQKILAVMTAYELTQENIHDRASICGTLVKKQRNQAILDTVDDGWWNVDHTQK